MSARIQFETGPCGRCGGCGEYSFNLMHGTRCYGCGGSGKRLSRKGKAARAKFDEFLVEHYMVRVEDLRAGDEVRFDHKWHRLQADPVFSGGGSWLDRETGYWVPFVDLKLPRCDWGVIPGTQILRRPTVEQFASEVVPFMRRYSGAIITETREAA